MQSHNLLLPAVATRLNCTAAVKARTAQIPLAQCIAYTERELAAAAVQAHTEQELVRALVEMHSAQCLAASVAHSQVRNIECMIPAVVEQVEAVVLTSVAAVQVEALVP